MAVVCSKVLLIEPPLIYTAPDTCVFGAVHLVIQEQQIGRNIGLKSMKMQNIAIALIIRLLNFGIHYPEI